MRQLKVISLFILSVLMFGLFSCTKDAVSLEHDLAFEAELQAPPKAEECFNFRVSGEGVPLGCVDIDPDKLPFPFPCPVFRSFGAKPFPVTIGDYDGVMYSVVTGMEQSGKGALHLTLVHVFHTYGGNFWTEDQAVCSPVTTDPTNCLVNDVLNIVGGDGIFDGISGKFHNHGLLTFGPPEYCRNCTDPMGEPSMVPTGSIDFKIWGRICVPVNGPV